MVCGQKQNSGFGNPGRVRPVDDVRLAPEIPAENAGLRAARVRRAPRRTRCRRRERPDGRGSSPGTISGLIAWPFDETNSESGYLSPTHCGSRVHVDLQHELQPLFLGELQQNVERLEIVAAFGRLPGRPVDPRPDGVEAERLDLADVLAPGLLLRPRVAVRASARAPSRRRTTRPSENSAASHASARAAGSV